MALPNISTQSAVLKKILTNQFGIELKSHQSMEIISRMMGFSDYQALLRGADKVSKRIFEGKVLHAVACAHYFSGEDEVCYILGQILNLLRKDYFVIEGRGHWSGYGITASPCPAFQIMQPGEYLQKSYYGKDHKDRDSSNDCFRHGANHLIAMSPIFPEVMLLSLSDHRDISTSKSTMDEYIKSKPFQTGIVSTGEGNKWRILNDISASTDFIPVYHLAISYTYAVKMDSVGALIDSIRAESPQSLIVAWVFEDDCAARGRNNQPRIYPTNHDKCGHNRQLIPGIGYVDIHPFRKNKDVAHEFFSPIAETLKEFDIPCIRVPSYKGHKIFISDPVMPNEIAERDRVTQEIMRQMEELGLVKKPNN